jgi:nucleotide-binding universal stress UspA family protein
MYQRIIVPLDGSELAEVALPYAEELASRLKTEAILFQVVPKAYHVYGAYEAVAQVPYTDEEMKPLKASAQGYLEKVSSRLEGKGINIRSEVTVGSAASEIIKLADEANTGIVTMSTHGRSGISRWALGSVADKVARGTKCPVAFIRAKGARPDVREKDILDKALVPLDGSKESEAVIPYIEELALKLEVEVTVLHMLAPDRYIYSEAQFKQIGSLKESAKDYIERVAAQLKQKGIVANAEFREVTQGAEAEEIIRLADETRADIVAMSTHGRSGIGRWAFGSVADRVLHEGNTPLLLVRPVNTGQDKKA